MWDHWQKVPKCEALPHFASDCFDRWLMKSSKKNPLKFTFNQNLIQHKNENLSAALWRSFFIFQTFFLFFSFFFLQTLIESEFRGFYGSAMELRRKKRDCLTFWYFFASVSHLICILAQIIVDKNSYAQKKPPRSYVLMLLLLNVVLLYAYIRMYGDDVFLRQSLLLYQA